MPGRTAWILADQLSTANAALDGADRALIVQSSSRPGRLRFHRQKLQLVFSAMRQLMWGVGAAAVTFAVGSLVGINIG